MLFPFQVKTSYINFLNHCYVDTEVEMKEIYNSTHIWTLFEEFMVDMAKVLIFLPYYIILSFARIEFLPM